MNKTQIIGALLVTVLLILGACAPPAPAPAPAPTPTPTPTPSTPVTLTSEDVEWLATVIASEAGSVYDKGSWVRCTDEERAAVGWTVLNRLGSGTFGQTIEEVVTAPGQYAHNQEPNLEIKEIARKLLKGQIEDTTDGATHFFSPISMPKEGESTAGFDIGGGLHEVSGIANKVYFPSWAKEPLWVGHLGNVRGAYFMFYRSETPITTPAPTPKPVRTPSKEAATITGTYTPCPEAEGKLQVTHRLLYEFGELGAGFAPRIELVIKNISDTEIYQTIRKLPSKGYWWGSSYTQRWTEKNYNWFTITVLSKDGAGNILGEWSTSIGSYHTALSPKEVRTEEVKLFSSDEVKSYEIITEYHPIYELPDISGVYIETPMVKNLVNLTHGTQKVDESSGQKRYYLSVWCEVKNISSKVLCEYYYPPLGTKEYVPESLDVKIVYKDASGEILDSLTWRVADGKTLGAGFKHLDIMPNEIRSFEFVIPHKIIEDINSYELTVEYQERVVIRR